VSRYREVLTFGRQLLLDGWKQQQNLAGVKWEQIEDGMKERMKVLHFVSNHIFGYPFHVSDTLGSPVR
jgi:hypothetical protein